MKELELEMDVLLEHVQQALGKEGEEKALLEKQLKIQTEKTAKATKTV